VELLERRPRALVVDDDPKLLTLEARWLSRAGFEVVLAASGEEALRLLDAEPGGFDALVSDLYMTGMTGLQLLEKIRAARIDVPVVLVTGEGALESAVAAFEHGVNRYLLKPLDGIKLVQSVTDVVRLHGVARMRKLSEDNQALGTLVDELRAARDSAEEAGRAKTQLLAKMSHELRTPLTAIMGNADLLLSEKQSDEQRARVTTIARAASSLLRMVDQLLDLGDLARNNVHHAPNLLGLRIVMEEELTPFAARAKAKGLEWTLDVASDVPEIVIGNEKHLRALIGNLADNAVKFTSAGRIVVRVEVARPTAMTTKDVWIRCAISDTGIGIPEPALARIFEPFAQADEAMNRRYGGAGLGLGICAHLARLVGGSLEAMSAQGEGSTFSFTARLKRHEGASRRSIPADAA